MTTTESTVDLLRAVRGFVLDMDGTLVLGDRRNHGLKALPGAVDLVRWLVRRGLPYTIFTNGTTRTPDGYAAELRAAGFALPGTAVMTPVSSAVDLFLRRGHRRVVVLGGDGMSAPLRAAGIEPVPPAGRPVADAVFVGWHPEFTMAELEAACHAVWHGAALCSASQVVFFATAEGRALGTSRAISAMISSVTGARVELVGKPSAHALRAAGHQLGVRPRDLAVVGDDPELEVPMAHRGKALAVAVTSGLAGAEVFGRLDRGPHLMLGGVGELLALCKAAYEEC